MPCNHHGYSLWYSCSNQVPHRRPPEIVHHLAGKSGLLASVPPYHRSAVSRLISTLLAPCSWRGTMNRSTSAVVILFARILPKNGARCLRILTRTLISDFFPFTL